MRLFFVDTLGDMSEWPKSNERAAVNTEIILDIYPAVPTFIICSIRSQIALFLVNAFGQTANVLKCRL